MTRRFLKLAFAPIFTAGLILGGCGAADTPQTSAISIENVVVIPPLPGRDVALGTFKLIVGDKDDVLLGGSSPLSPHIEMHTHIKEGDVMKMRRINELAVTAGQTVEFKRGGYHLMFFKADIERGVKTAPVTLTFKNTGDVTVTAKISGYGSDDDKAPDHSGH